MHRKTLQMPAANLYLLTARAVFSGDLQKICQVITCTSKRRVLAALESERVLKAMRPELAGTDKEAYGENVSLDNEQMRAIISDTFRLSAL